MEFLIGLVTENEFFYKTNLFILWPDFEVGGERSCEKIDAVKRK